MKTKAPQCSASVLRLPVVKCGLWTCPGPQLGESRCQEGVLDDRSKILTTSGEKHDAQPGRERRRPDRSTGLHRGDAPLDKGEPCLTALVDQIEFYRKRLREHNSATV